jgi:hypothetical protein
MARRGSENRRKVRSVLVRLTEREYLQLTERAMHEKATRADYLRRCMRDADPAVGRAHGSDGTGILSEQDRVLLAGATRTMGHLAGLIKLAALKSPAQGSPTSIRTLLEEHHRSLQDLQGKIRRLLDRMQ